MLPINKSNNQQNCNPISSNCVTWQGPDIACINLQNGDTVSDVTYKLALELCTILDQTNLTGFDLSCFDPICPKPENFHDLVQFIIDKLCELSTAATVVTPTTGTTTSAITTGTCPDCTITIAPCFYYTDQFGNNITTMNIADYAAAIGAKVCTLSTQFAALQTTVSSQGTRITNLENQFANLVIPIPTVYSSCLSPGNSIDVNIFCQDLEDAFCTLRTATGTAASITTAIGKQCTGLDNAPRLSDSGVMGLTPGWVSQANYSTAADAINNLWLTVCDLRAALENVLNNCCNDAAICAQITVDMSATISTSIVSIAYTGTAPTAFVDCASGLTLTIKDKYGFSYSTTPSVIANLNQPVVAYDISSSPVQNWCDLDITLNMCAVDNASGIVCSSIKTASVNNANMPFTITPAVGTTTIDYSITNLASGVSSSVDTVIYAFLYNSAGTAIIASQMYTNNTSATINDTFDGLTSGTSYKIRCDVKVGTYLKTGSFQNVTTL